MSHCHGGTARLSHGHWSLQLILGNISVFSILFEIELQSLYQRKFDIHNINDVMYIL